MAKIIQSRHLDKDDPIYTGRFIFTSHSEPQSNKEKGSLKQDRKEEDQS